MNKYKEYLIGFLVAIVVFVGSSEFQKSNNREEALRDLNSSYSKITNPASKNALLIKTNTIIGENQSWFSLNNSRADEAGPDTSYGDGCEPFSNDWVCNLRNDEDPVGTVTTEEVVDVWLWFNPTTGSWVSGGDGDDR
jgi:hypothetical protein